MASVGGNVAVALGTPAGLHKAGGVGERKAASQHPAAAPAYHVVPPVMEAADEEGRLRAVRALHLIGAPPQPKFQMATALMKQMFETPVAAVTLIDVDLHFVSRAGDWACSAGRPGSFCDWLLVPETPRMLIVENALEDARHARPAAAAERPAPRPPQPPPLPRVACLLVWACGLASRATLQRRLCCVDVAM